MAEETPLTTLSPEYHIAIGVITVNAAIMDQLIDNAIWVVMKLPPERGVTITKLLVSTTRKIKFLRDLLNPMFENDEIKKDFQKVYSKLKSAQANRSKIVHAKWVVLHPDKSIHIELPLSDETLPEVEAMPLKKLQRYGSEIAKAHRALEDFFLRVEMKPETTGNHIWPPRFEARKYKKKK